MLKDPYIISSLAQYLEIEEEKIRMEKFEFHINYLKSLKLDVSQITHIEDLAALKGNVVSFSFAEEKDLQKILEITEYFQNSATDLIFYAQRDLKLPAFSYDSSVVLEGFDLSEFRFETEQKGKRNLMTLNSCSNLDLSKILRKVFF